MTETGTTNAQSVSRPAWGLALVLVTFTAIVHGWFGWQYATRFSPQAAGLSHPTSRDQYLGSFPGWNTDSEQDAAGFNRAAMSILAHGLPYSRQGTLILRTAVYSYFVAGCYVVGGVGLLPIVIAQAILSGLTCWILVMVAGRLFVKSAMAPWIAGGLYLLNLRVAMYVGYIVPLIPTLFFMAVAFWAAAQRPGRLASACLVAGLVLGMYTSSTFFVVALAGALWLLLRPRSIIGAVVIIVFVALKFVVTWSNAAGSAAEPNRAGDRGGIFWLSNNPYYDRMRPWSLWEWRGSNPWSTWTASDGEREHYAQYLTRSGQNELRATLLWIRENPGRYLQVCLARLRTEFSPYTGQMSPRNRHISAVIWLLIFPAGLYGLWLSRRDPTAQFAALVILAVFTFATFVTEEPYLRYRLPVDLLLTVFAGVAYWKWARCLRRKSNSSNTAAMR
jgi:hypothetical protein